MEEYSSAAEEEQKSKSRRIVISKGCDGWIEMKILRNRICRYGKTSLMNNPTIRFFFIRIGKKVK